MSMHISVLRNTIQHYAWGSKSAIPKLLGETNPTGDAWAELWIGAHPQSPSKLGGCNLDHVIQRAPETALGYRVANRFQKKLPFLLKVLAADQPLSLQCHPNVAQAQKGFGRENWNLIELSSPRRCYKDTNHKPELLCALSPFRALKGFRPIEEIVDRFQTLDIPTLRAAVERLSADRSAEGLRRFFQGLLHAQPQVREAWTAQAVSRASGLRGADYQLIESLHAKYPGDIGVLSPMLLNLIELQPHEAIFLEAGELHVYLWGLGVEIMANSDNVLRAGLTQKHIDIKELSKIASFEPSPARILQPSATPQSTERAFETPVDEFKLSIIEVKANEEFLQYDVEEVEMLLAVEGEAIIHPKHGGSFLRLPQGEAAFVPACVEGYRITGDAKLFRATTGV